MPAPARPPAVPTPARPDELDAVVRLVATEQARVERRITYVGVEADGIRAELDGLEPPWLGTLRVLRDGDRIGGAVAVEWDEELGRSWVIGPWVVADDEAAWQAGAAALVDAALALVPVTVTRHELSGEAAHRRLADLAAARGWGATGANHVLVADADVVTAWPEADGDGPVIREAEPGDVDAIAARHDAEFPGTYADAARLVAGQRDGSRVVLVAEADVAGTPAVVGYAAGEVHDDGEGYVDFLAVDRAMRGRGLGRRLVVALTRRLLDRSPRGRVALTVQDHRAPARALYASLGFRSDGVLVGYRSWEPHRYSE